MPSRYLHRQLSKFLVNDGCDRTHRMMDYPVKFLRNRHRIFFHDPLSASLIGFLADGRNGFYAGISHIVLDYCCSNFPVVKYFVENYSCLKKIKELLQ